MGRHSPFFRILAVSLLSLGFGTTCEPKPRPERVPSLATGAPLVVTMPSGRTDIFVLGSDGSIWQSTCTKNCSKRSNFTNWSRQPGKPPGGITSDPGGVAWGEGRIDLFVRGSIANVWHQTWENGTWLGWEDLDGRTASGPTATSWAVGNLHIFVLAGNAVWHRACVAADSMPSCRGGNWMPWIPDSGGPPIGAVAVGHAVSNAHNNIDIALRGNDGALWFQRWAGGYWIGWRSLGGQLATSPTLVPAAGRTEAYALDANGVLIRAFIDSADAPLVWTPATVQFHAEPRGAFLADDARALLVSRAPGSPVFDAASCAPGAECTKMQ
jgi:hypothetical protein